MRTSRIRTAALAATTAALALATLTACGSSDGGDDAKGAGKSGGAVVSEKASGGKSGAAEGGTGTGGATVDAAKGTDAGSSSTEGATVNARKGSGSQASGSKGSGSKASAAGIRACDGQEISYSVTHRFAKQRGEHLLITATNADSKACYVTSFPSVMLGDTANVLPHSAKDTPGGGKALTIKPGGKVYAAVNLFTDRARTRTATGLSIAMTDHTGDSGPGVDQEAFANGVPSKFTWSTADVTNWNTAKPYDF